MKIGIWAGHVGSQGLAPSGQYGGGESHTFGFAHILNQYYDVTLVVQNGVYPDIESAARYGLDLDQVQWKPVGDNIDWMRQFDVLVSMNHGVLAPPICNRNILVTFFPQYAEWDVSGYDTFIANSQFTAKWMKRYWAVEADVVYPPVDIQSLKAQINDYTKTKRIVCIGRFFDVPGGNNKQHMTVLSAFKDLMRPDWQLVFVGSIQNRKYYMTVRDAAAGDDRVEFMHDVSRQEYVKLLAESALVWSATGYQTESPSSKEHFGVFIPEAMACGTIPLVHNSGGAPETGALTWETPAELLEKTRDIISDGDKLAAESQRVYAESDRFDMMTKTQYDLIRAIEKPVLVEPIDSQFKIFVGDLKPSDIKVGVWSDSPARSYGFSTVTASLVKGLIARGFKVACIGEQHQTQGEPDLRVEDVMADCRQALGGQDHFLERFEALLRKRQVCPIWRKVQGAPYSNVAKFLDVEKPDILYLNYDIGNIRLMIDHLREIQTDLPLVCYFPIEGQPVIPQYIETIRLIQVLNGKPITYTRFGRQAIAEAGGPLIDFVYHGGDHAPFAPINSEMRKTLRFAIGWESKFVCMFVGRNKRTKGFGTLLQAAKILKEKGRDDILWYLHTDIHDQVANSSQPLDQMVHMAGLDDVVQFPMNMSQGIGIPYDEAPSIGEVPDTDDLRLVRSYNRSALSLIELYCCANAFVNASEMEGFGLPAIEAMGCGLPVISVDDKAVQREVLGPAPIYVPTSHFDPSWQTSAMLAQANPAHIAEAVEALADKAQLQQELSLASRQRHAEFKWENFVEAIATAIMEQVE